MARRSRGYVQLEWVCPNCSTRNPGPTKSCVNCGAPQPEDVKFERAAEEKTVTDAEAIRAAAAGADYICPYCATRNSALAKVCVQCGGDLVEAKRRAAGEVLQANTGPRQVTCTNCGTTNPVSRSNCLKCGAPLPRSARTAAAQATAAAAASPPKKSSRAWIWAAVAGLLLLCVGAVLLFALPTSTLEATVTDVRWDTAVPVQEMQAVRYANERGNPRSGAYDVSCHDESREVCTERVVDQGNGFGEVVEDCHTETEQYCSYTVDEWKTIQTYALDGHNFAPVYAQPNIAAGQRLGEESVDFTVVFNTEDGPRTYSPSDLAEFAMFEVGSTWTLRLNGVGTILDVTR